MIDKYAIRELNEKLILKTIIQYKHISRADLSKITKLNKSTISSIISTFLEKNYVREIGVGESSGGRKPILIELNESAGFTLNINLGENFILAELMDLNNMTISKEEYLELTINSDSVLEYLSMVIDNFLNRAPKSSYGIVGVCIAIHGIVHNNTLIFSPFYSFNDLDVADILNKKYQIPIHLENEANLSVIGEKTITTNIHHIISISVHSGIGAGVILDGTLFTGINGRAGEVGHMIGIIDGKECPCGNKGCIEQYSSELSLLTQYAQKSNKKSITFEQFKLDYQENIQAAHKIMDLFIQYISVIIQNIGTSFNPGIIIINSKFTNEIDGIINKINENLSSKLISGTSIYSSILGEQAIMLGAAHINVQHFFKLS